MRAVVAIFLVTSLVVASATPSWKLPKATDDSGDLDSSREADDRGSSKDVDKDKEFKDAVLASNPNFFKGTEDDDTTRAMFDEWRASFKKRYTSRGAYKVALRNFKENLKRSASINRNKAVSYYSDLNNQFADMSFTEFQAKYLMKQVFIQGADVATAGNAPGGSRRLQQAIVSSRASRTKDWRLEDRVTAVKDQAGCGSCWAFSATAAIESAFLIATQTNASTSRLDLSEQQLVSCVSPDNGYRSQGCNGGGSDDAIRYVVNAQQTSELAYPYTSGTTGVSGACSTGMIASAAPASFAKLGGVTSYFQRNSQAALMSAVDAQPVIIYFHVASDFFSYTSGVYTPAVCNAQVNHAMVVEGYKWTGSTSTSFWIVRNSWGPGWGENGYVRIRMTGEGAGPCLLQTFPHAPSLTFSKLPTVF